MLVVGHAMASRIEIVRLLGAIAVGVAACLFVGFYSQASGLTFEQTFGRGVPLPFLTRCVAEYAAYAYIFPAVVLVAALFLMRRGHADFVVEIIVGITWIAALAWVLFAIWAWRIAMIRIV